MNTRILDLYQNQAIIKASDVNMLEKEIRKQPYMQSLRSLHLLAVHKFQPEKYQQTLALTAAYTTDKKVLYELINGKKKHIVMPNEPLPGLANDPIKPLREEVVSQMASAPKSSAPVEKPAEKTLAEKLQAIAQEKAQLNKDLADLKAESQVESPEEHQVETEVILEEKPQEQVILEEKPSIENIETNENQAIEAPTLSPAHLAEERLIATMRKFDEFVKDPANIKTDVVDPDWAKTKGRQQENQDDEAFQGQTSFHETTTDGDDFWIKNPIKNTPEVQPIQAKNLEENHQPKIEEAIAEVLDLADENPSENSLATEAISQNQPEIEAPMIEEIAADWQPMQINLPKQDALIAEQAEPVLLETPAVLAKVELLETPPVLPEAAQIIEPKVEASTQIQASQDIIVAEEIKADIKPEPRPNTPVATEILAIETKHQPEDLAPEPTNTEILQEEISIAEANDLDTDSNVGTFISTWKSWLKMSPSKPNADKNDPKTYIIDRFIDLNPKLVKKPEQEFKFVEKDGDISHLMTETLAKIYIDQKYYAKAIWAYQILLKKYPEKKFEFKNQIKAINKLMK
jgi:hypothetical protein